MKEDTRKAFCTECCTETLQHKTYFDPDNPDYGEVWTCSVCLEAIEIVESD